MMTERQRALLQALDSIEEPRSAIDLYDIYDEELKPHYETINHLQAGLSYFRKIGVCDNGISEIIDGRTRLTWMLTILGFESLKTGVIPEARSESATGLPPEAPKRYDIESVKKQLSEMLDRHFSKPEIKIDRIDAKIAALDVIGSSSFIAQDLRIVLNELAEELQKIQEAA